MATKEATTKDEKTPKNPDAPEDEVEVVEYKLTATDVVIRVKDGVPIPNDPNDPNRVAYEQWAMAGGVATPADVPQPSPTPMHEPPADTRHPAGAPPPNVTMTTPRTRER